MGLAEPQRRQERARHVSGLQSPRTHMAPLSGWLGRRRNTDHVFWAAQPTTSCRTARPEGGTSQEAGASLLVSAAWAHFRGHPELAGPGHPGRKMSGWRRQGHRCWFPSSQTHYWSVPASQPLPLDSPDLRGGKAAGHP